MTSIVLNPKVSISADDLIGLLLDIRGATIVSFVAATEPRLTAGNPFPGLRKLSSVNGVLNFNYTSAVNRQRVKEGMIPDFVAEPRKWGIRMEGTPIVKHGHKHYVECKVESSTIIGYIMPDLSSVDPEEVAKWLPNRHSGRQAVEKAVILRDFSIENVRSMKLRKVEYVIN